MLVEHREQLDAVIADPHRARDDRARRVRGAARGRARGRGLPRARRARPKRKAERDATAKTRATGKERERVAASRSAVAPVNPVNPEADLEAPSGASADWQSRRRGPATRSKPGVRLILEGIGEDPDAPGLLDTPRRVAEMYEEIFVGHRRPTRANCSSPCPATITSEMVLVKDIAFYSICEHHLLPFLGTRPRGLHPRASRPHRRAVQAGPRGAHRGRAAAAPGAHHLRGRRRHDGGARAARRAGADRGRAPLHVDARRAHARAPRPSPAPSAASSSRTPPRGPRSSRSSTPALRPARRAQPVPLPGAQPPVDLPCVMGILNVTPDSFSDGGLFAQPEAAVAPGRAPGRRGRGHRRRRRRVDAARAPTRCRVDAGDAPRRAGRSRRCRRRRRGARLGRHHEGRGGAPRPRRRRRAWSTTSRALRHDPEMAGVVAERRLPRLPHAHAGRAQDHAGRPALRRRRRRGLRLPRGAAARSPCARGRRRAGAARSRHRVRQDARAQPAAAARTSTASSRSAGRSCWAPRASASWERSSTPSRRIALGRHGGDHRASALLGGAAVFRVHDVRPNVEALRVDRGRAPGRATADEEGRP